MSNMANPKEKLVLVSGATGYVGGRLIPELLKKGFRVRAMGRSIKKLQSRPWAALDGVELSEGDVFNKQSLVRAAWGCEAAYYLVHSMLPGQSNFQAADKEAAVNMRNAASDVGLKRIIYLGGLGEDDVNLSQHLKSRKEVADILRQGKVPVTVLRAAMIIGSGSASFEILRYLVDRLPLMITPKWLETPNQPIAIRNVITYLVECLSRDETTGQTYDIGGSEVLTYRKLMQIYQEEAHLPKRWVIPVPVLTPRLSSYWIHLITPVPASLARPLAEGLKNPVICKNADIQKLIPQHLLSPREAISAALKGTKENTVKSHWTDAGLMPPVEAVYAGDPKWSGGTVLKDARSKTCKASVEETWKAILRIGGENGWYHGDWLWRLRGELDKIFGGVGLRRGRRSAEEVRPGDALDFWRVLSVKEKEHLLLLAEMKLPGTATLEFKLKPGKEGLKVEQVALFKPKGLWGIIYWCLVLPFHYYIFEGMLTKLVQYAERVSKEGVK